MMWRKPLPVSGRLLLAVWLIVIGLREAVDLHFFGLGLLTGILALAAGVLLLMGR